MLVQTGDANGVRTLTLNRPDALNAFNEALYDATTIALLEADEDPSVAVIMLTGAGRAFSAGNDLLEMQARITDPDFVQGEHGFPGLIRTLTALRKPLILARVGNEDVCHPRPFPPVPSVAIRKFRPVSWAHRANFRIFQPH